MTLPQTNSSPSCRRRLWPSLGLPRITSVISGLRCLAPACSVQRAFRIQARDPGPTGRTVCASSPCDRSNVENVGAEPFHLCRRLRVDDGQTGHYRIMEELPIMRPEYVGALQIPSFGL